MSRERVDTSEDVPGEEDKAENGDKITQRAGESSASH